MNPDTNKLEIVGAGPAGLASAVAGSARRASVTVHERHGDVGHRFHGDFQGLENWTTQRDVLEELDSLGIRSTFDHVPFRELTVFDWEGRSHGIRSDQPLWYLVRRGSEPGTLDHALKTQAIEAGAILAFNSKVEHLPRGGIVAHGPRRADVIAVGYVFETTCADGAYAVVSDTLAPKGYSYLLISQGRATVASCLFDDFHNEKTYLARTVDFFQDQVGMQMSNGKRFGGFGNAYDSMTTRRSNLLYVGEAAGLQDALFGFGMRFALLSGAMAADAWVKRKLRKYDAACRSRFGHLVRLSWANRFMYDHMGNAGYSRLLKHIGAQTDARAWLRRYYTKGVIRSMMARYARRRLNPTPTPPQLSHEHCDCTWCTCERRSQRPDGHVKEGSTV